MELLCHYDWPGNVRELRSMVECLAAKADGRIITKEQVRREIEAEQSPALRRNTHRLSMSGSVGDL